MFRILIHKLFLLFVVLLVFTGCWKSNHKPAANVPDFDAEIIRIHNEGVALMGRFDYAQAFEKFEQLAEKYPNWADVQIDLAIAALNRRQTGDSELAMQRLNAASTMDPKNLRSYFCQGILLLDSGDPTAANEMFAKVQASDPDDAYATYFSAQCLSQLADTQKALPLFLAAIELDPYLRSSYYGVFQIYMRLGEIEKAKEFQEDFQRLADNPQARLAEIKYTRMGPKATVQPIFVAESDRQIPEGQLFADPRPLLDSDLPAGSSWDTQLTNPASITCCDVDQDGDVDLFFANSISSGEQTVTAIGLQQPDGRFRMELDHPLSSIPGVNAALWGDYDNDGFVDVYFCRDGFNQLWRQESAGEWKNVTDATGTAGADVKTVDGAVADSDHDGDLDYLLLNAGPNELLSNNLDGTFRSLADASGLNEIDALSNGSLFADLDNDRDADILILNQGQSHQVRMNDRLWEYHDAAGFEELAQEPLTAVVSFDFDSDGQVEIFSVGDRGLCRWSRNQDGQWVASVLQSELGEATSLAAADVNGNGSIELVAATRNSFVVVDSDSGSTLERIELENVAPIDGWQLATIGGNGPSLVMSFAGKPPLVMTPGTARYLFSSFSFSGKEDKGEQMRSNRSGIGVNVAVRNGTAWTSFATFDQQSMPGQSLQPTPIGLGTSKSFDFVQMTWPDGVFQTEINLVPQQLNKITETQRQVASCPVVFAWNGEKFEFVTDVLGVGGIGFNLGKGEYGDPRPWENLLLPSELLSVKDQHYELRIGEPMEEACYLDAARLHAYDLPQGWQMVMDERLGIADPLPTGLPIFFRQEATVVSAYDNRGNEITNRLTAVDDEAAASDKLDHRFIGRTSPYSMAITFSEPIDFDKPVLVFDGWVEYPYSQTMFAAWQAKATFDAPTIEAQDEQGEWHTVVEQFGYMAGMPRRSAFPLPVEKLPAGCTTLRITSNIEIYWDRISIARQEECDQVRKTNLPLTSATVNEAGFAKRHTFSQRRPYYDYNRRDPFWDTRHMTGNYTKFGDALPLVQAVDDASAIFGPGEEVRLSYLATLDDIPNGWTRRFVLETNGWAKDKDLFTRDGDTLAPIPIRPSSKDDSQRNLLHQRFNRRFRVGY